MANILRVSISLGVGPVHLRVPYVVLLCSTVYEVNRNLEIRWAWHAGCRVPESDRYVLGDPLDSLHLLRELGHGLEEGRRIEVLQSAT